MPFPLDIRFVKRAEEKLGRKLPQGYVAKMCLANGGKVATGTDEWNLYPIFDDSDRKMLKRTCNNIIRETASASSWPDFPADALAIGGNGCGDQLVFLADPESDRFAETVYWWDHETGTLNRVSESFERLKIGSFRRDSLLVGPRNRNLESGIRIVRETEKSMTTTETIAWTHPEQRRANASTGCASNLLVGHLSTPPALFSPKDWECLAQDEEALRRRPGLSQTKQSARRAETKRSLFGNLSQSFGLP